MYGDVRADQPIRVKTTKPKFDPLIPPEDRCIRVACNRKAVAKGLCKVHYNRIWHREVEMVRGRKLRSELVEPSPATCTVPGCQRPYLAKGMCDPHYRRFRRHGDVMADVPFHKYGDESRCSVEGCERRHRGKGFCNAHYSRWVNHGDPLAVTALGVKRNGAFLIKPYRIIETGELVE